MRKKRRIFLVALMIGGTAAALTMLVLAAYFAKGVFKDVFVNKKDYFSADVLYEISSIDDDNKPEVGSGGVRRWINIYNHDIASGDFNSFDTTFDVYAWLDKALPEGKQAYTISDSSGHPVPVSTTEHTQPVLHNLTLSGGMRSTVTLTVDFGFAEDDDLTDAPVLNIVAVPTAPERLSGSYLGAVLRPTMSEAFFVNADFEHIGTVNDYAAFTYLVSTVGNAQTGDKIVIKWKSDALILMHINREEPDALSVQTGDFGDGFDRMIKWDAESNHTDTLVFFRNSKNEMWTGTPDWGLLRSQISTEYVKNNT